MAKLKDSASKMVDAVERARELARNVLKLKEDKQKADEEIKKSLEELTALAKEYPEWFKHPDTGELMKSVSFGSAKLCWAKQSPSYRFTHNDLDLIRIFSEKFPNSIDYKFKAMLNIPLEEFGIEKKEFEDKLSVEAV
jgi:hypothetical protein